MAILPIIHYPDPRLHKIAAPVTAVDESIRKLVRDMAETMYAAPGVGLAATQVDVHKQVIVIDMSETTTSCWCLVNPKSSSRRGRVRVRGRLPVGARHIRQGQPRGVDHGAGAGRRRQAVRARSATASWPCASSTKWTT